jgi:hypothetical protein
MPKPRSSRYAPEERYFPPATIPLSFPPQEKCWEGRRSPDSSLIVHANKGSSNPMQSRMKHLRKHFALILKARLNQLQPFVRFG